MNTYGNVTPKAIFLNIESHKLHETFTVGTGATIYPGQTVKFDATGSVVPAVAGDTTKDRIGISIHGRASTDSPFPYGSPGSEVTVIMRGFVRVRAEAGAALVPGPVKLSGLNATTKIPQYIQSVGGDTSNDGWSISVATAIGQEIEVVLH